MIVHYFSLPRVFSLLILASTTFVEANVSYQGHTFDSMPAHFGMAWSPPERTYQAHLQLLDECPRLCQSGSEEQGLSGLVLPNESLPVALLVERGDCSFEMKVSLSFSISFLLCLISASLYGLMFTNDTYSLFFFVIERQR